MLGETGGKTADVTFGLVNVIKLFFVGVVAAGNDGCAGSQWFDDADAAWIL